MKIAIVHEMLVKLWWAEKVVAKLMQMFPEADIYTLVYDEKKVEKIFPKKYGKWKVIQTPTGTQTIYNITKNQRFCLPFMPKAIESFDFSKYDVVFVSSSWFAHGVITKPETKTIIYYHSPARYLWDWTNEYKKDIWWEKWWKWYILTKIFQRLREWDFIVAQRDTITLANSQNVAKRIQKYYRKTSQVLYPPIEVTRFQKEITQSISQEILQKNWLQSKQYYVILSALSEFKNIDIAIQGFFQMQKANLVIIGEWPLKEKFQQSSKNISNIHILWAKYDDELVVLVQNALWLIFPGEEDFWIVPIEAFWAGIPVFAYKGWWLLESNKQWETGEFFDDIKWSDFIEKFQKFHEKNLQWTYKKHLLQDYAQQFDEWIFEEKITHIINTGV